MEQIYVDKLLDLEIGRGDILDDGGEERKGSLFAVHHLWIEKLAKSFEAMVLNWWQHESYRYDTS